MLRGYYLTRGVIHIFPSVFLKSILRVTQNTAKEDNLKESCSYRRGRPFCPRARVPVPDHREIAWCSLNPLVKEKSTQNCARHRGSARCLTKTSHLHPSTFPGGSRAHRLGKKSQGKILQIYLIVHNVMNICQEYRADAQNTNFLCLCHRLYPKRSHKLETRSQ